MKCIKNLSMDKIFYLLLRTLQRLFWLKNDNNKVYLQMDI